MSYGEVSYGEVSYGEEGGGDDGTRILTEFVNTSSTIVGKWNSGNAFVEAMGVDDSGIIGKKAYNTFNTDGASLSDVLSSVEILNVIESITASDTVTPTSSFDVLAIEAIGVDDTLYVGFPISVVEAMGINDTLVVEKAQFITALEQVEVAEILSTATVWNMGVSDDLQIYDLADIRFGEILSEILNTSSTLLVHRVARVVEGEIVELSDTIAESIRYSMELLAEILVSEVSLETSQSTSQEIIEDIALSELIEKTDIEGYVMNPENYAISKYLLGFTESTAFGNQFLFADDTGLYELGGTTDNGSAIVSTIKTSALDLGTSNIKQVPSVMLGTNGTKTILKVSVDGSHTTHYEVTGRSSALMTKRVDLGKGLKGKYWQFTLISDSSDFDLDSFEFYPIIFGRKHNG